MTEVADLFALSLDEYRALSGGVSTNYLIESEEGEFVISVLDRSLGLSAQVVNRLLSHLGDHGIRVPTPRYSLLGNAVETVGNHSICVKQFVRGTVHDIFPSHLLADAGEALAEVHLLPSVDWLPAKSKRMINLEAEVSSWPNQEFASWILRNATDAENELGDEVQPAILHGDYFSDNIVVRDDDSIVIIDWEEATVDSPIRDLGFAILGMSDNGSVFNPQRSKLFIEGYERVRKLSASENSQLRAATISASTWIARRRYVRHHINFPYPPMQNRYALAQAFVDDLQIRWPSSVNLAQL